MAALFADSSFQPSFAIHRLIARLETSCTGFLTDADVVLSAWSSTVRAGDRSLVRSGKKEGFIASTCARAMTCGFGMDGSSEYSDSYHPALRRSKAVWIEFGSFVTRDARWSDARREGEFFITY